MTIFQGMGRHTTKMDETFSMENEVPDTVLKFFLKKAHTGWMKAKKLVLGAHFLPYQWFYWVDCFQKQ